MDAVGQYEATCLADGPWDYACTGPVDHPIRGRLDQGNLAKMVDLAAGTAAPPGSSKAASLPTRILAYRDGASWQGHARSSSDAPTCATTHTSLSPVCR
ncbi:hypothetical protein ACFWNT_09445 [Streptomyces sp. NPDC058409]|uniref:hypothetical protein n=1 Tax=Streptomyces sp. NPDC058409 TaxID=3346484 RepID=UPI003660F160